MASEPSVVFVPFSLYEDLQLPTDKSPVKRRSFSPIQGPQCLTSRFLRLRVDLMGEFVGLRAPPPGIGKDVEVADVQFFQKLIGFPELFFPLPGETDDDIYTDIEVRDMTDQGLDQVGEGLSIVIALHSPQDFIIAALHGNVKMVTEPRGRGDASNQFRAKISGLNGAQPDPLGCGVLLYSRAEFDQ